MQIERSNIPTSYNGGVVPILNTLRKLQIPEVIEECLGKRVKQSKYSNQDMVMSWIITILSQGYRLLRIEDTAKDLSSITDLRVPSHDTMGRFFKKLSTCSRSFKVTNPKNPNDGVKEYTMNENPLLNSLLIEGTKQMGLLKENVPYTMDIDVTLLESEVYDSKLTYKGFKGFSPMVCMINQLPVYISMRSGNANPHFKKLDCLVKAIEFLKNHKITVDRVRIDGAGYKNEILDYLDSQGIKFVIGANWSERTQRIVFQSKNWEKRRVDTSTHSWEAELASSKFKLAASNKEYIITVIRIRNDKRKDKDKPTKWHLFKGFYYKFIITNDSAASPFDIIQEYHQRGTFEGAFSALKNDFGWKTVPFSKLNENLSYMLITALTSNIYQGLLQIFTKVVKKLDPTLRLDRFRRLFIRVCVTYIKGVLTYYGNKDIPYEKIT